MKKLTTFKVVQSLVYTQSAAIIKLPAYFSHNFVNTSKFTKGPHSEYQMKNEAFLSKPFKPKICFFLFEKEGKKQQ